MTESQSLRYMVVETDSLSPHSDKCILPPSLLRHAIDSHPELPHPLVFLLNGSVLVGVKEFTAPDATILAPGEVVSRLGPSSSQVSCVLVSSLPRASFLRLKPTQFYPHVTNWKYYLESFLSTHYTTLSRNQIFSFDDPVSKTTVSLSVEETNADSVIVVDTDIALDVMPLNDIMAAQQLQQDSQLSALEHVAELVGPVSFELVPFHNAPVPCIYKINLHGTRRYVRLSLSCDADPFNIDLLAGLDKFVNLENFSWCTMLQDSDQTTTKTIWIDCRTDRVADYCQKHHDSNSAWLYVVPFAWEHTARVNMDVCFSDSLDDLELSHSQDTIEQQAVSDTSVRCHNCSKSIDKKSFSLHEAFCLRNNVRCSCGQVFTKTIPSTHWHCEQCPDTHSESALFQFKHSKLIHSQPYVCEQCDDSGEYASYLELVQSHKATTCPAKLHECTFCHLIVPQEASTFEDRFQNLTHHESMCGNKTSECFRCGKVLRNRDLASHLKIHDLDKVEENSKPIDKCANVNCANILEHEQNPLGLCGTCYGPLYLTEVDVNNMKLQSRIERRYVLQLTKGCGGAWCQNSRCATNHTKMDIKTALKCVQSELLPQIHAPSLPINAPPSLPINAARSAKGPNKFWLCVSESVQHKARAIEALRSDGFYSDNMIYKAVAAGGPDGAREWLLANSG